LDFFRPFPLKGRKGKPLGKGWLLLAELVPGRGGLIFGLKGRITQVLIIWGQTKTFLFPQRLGKEVKGRI